MVFVLNKDKTPLAPCSEKKAKKLLNKNKAVIHRLQPMVIRMKEYKDVTPDGLVLKVDPGSKTTGFAVMRIKNKDEGDAIMLGELVHKSGKPVKGTLNGKPHMFFDGAALYTRRTLRRARRNRKTRYRKNKILSLLKKRNKRRKDPKTGRLAGWPVKKTQRKNWLPPSLKAKANQTIHLVEKLMKWLPIEMVSIEHVKFDTQKMKNPEINGVEYQQGTLSKYTTREYLLEKFDRKCAYCGAENVPLEIEHIVPKSKAGTNRVDNLTIACVECNRKKGNMLPEEWLNYLKKSKSKKSDVLAKNFQKAIKKAKATLKDAAAVNSTRWYVYNQLKDRVPHLEAGSGALTKMNRTKHKLPKEHYYDACCVGKSTPETINIKTSYVVVWRYIGRGKRCLMINDGYGFPRNNPNYIELQKDGQPKGHRMRTKSVNGIHTGDLVKAYNKKHESKIGRATIRRSGSCYIAYKEDDKTKRFSFQAKNAKVLQYGDGWEYSKRKLDSQRYYTIGDNPEKAVNKKVDERQNEIYTKPEKLLPEETSADVYAEQCVLF